MLTHFEFTEAKVRGAKMPPGKAQAYCYDTKVTGLAVRMRESGGKSYVYFVPHNKGGGRVTIGDCARFTVEQARDAARIHAGEISKGGTPKTAKYVREETKLAAKGKGVTLGSLILNDPVAERPGPYEASLLRRKVVNVKNAMSALRRGLAGHLKDDVKKLTLRDIMAKVDAIAATGKEGAAGDLRKHSHTFLEWAKAQGYVDYNVLAGYRKPKSTRAERIGKRTKGRALTDEEIKKVWAASGRLGTFGLLARFCLLGGPRRSEPAQIEWDKHVMADRVTFDEKWTKMGMHHDVPRTRLIDSVLAAAEHFRRATSDNVFPSPKTGGTISGWTKLVDQLIEQADVAKFTMHDLRRTLRTIMSRCGYSDDIQRICVGQKPKAKLDQIYNHDEQWTIRKMAFDAAHDYIAELVGAPRAKNVVRIFRDPIKNELLKRLQALSETAA